MRGISCEGRTRGGKLCCGGQNANWGRCRRQGPAVRGSLLCWLCRCRACRHSREKGNERGKRSQSTTEACCGLCVVGQVRTASVREYGRQQQQSIAQTEGRGREQRWQQRRRRGGGTLMGEGGGMEEERRWDRRGGKNKGSRQANSEGAWWSYVRKRA